MHLSSEVSSTTNIGSENDHRKSKKSTADEKAAPQPFTAETLAERTLDSLIAEHPGELSRTGSPHIVSWFYDKFWKLRIEMNLSIKGLFNTTTTLAIK